MGWQYVENAGIRFFLPGLVLLMLLASMAAAQSVRGDVPQDLMLQPLHLGNSVRLPDRPAAADQPALKFSMKVVAEPTASRRWQTTSESPVSPASIFAWQTNLCKYLDNWPAPGATVALDDPPDGELDDEDLM
jgi:hypothetical protein